ncbi:sulfite exporter TauE/SafE family protein [Streptomyces sp. DSM 44915]|uniref:Probable membrane transporter protein n=1 Tax=Streptomyces chisholmiae TaxID=3075540 RepID=A0ABU2JQP2_9ACTN|nr:sulfite exporter TauE/SafE family protein [Streptomyces sp. DSM 44915]MDT0267051.1 sulfite exporter TauE/SafE family protein [Streptomyces sp. DSM 44915]
MDLGGGELALLAVAAVLVGVAKTAIGGVASITVALFATALPAKESSGALLPLLIVGDLLAVAAYRRHADWSALLRLFPSVAAGILAGTWFVSRVDDTVMRRTIGGVLLFVVLVHLWQRRRRGESKPPAVLFGLLAGFTTMVANAGGAVMAVYLLAAGFPMLTFLGTAAWFFLIVNLFKVPFSAGLGLITVESLGLNALLIPGVLLGALLGRLLIRWLQKSDRQQLFQQLILGFTVVSALNLLR